jgi:hypothetical protein
LVQDGIVSVRITAVLVAAAVAVFIAATEALAEVMGDVSRKVKQIEFPEPGVVSYRHIA